MARISIAPESILKQWMLKNGHTYDSAALALGVARTTLAQRLRSGDIPKIWALAMAALDAGLDQPKKIS